MHAARHLRWQALDLYARRRGMFYRWLKRNEARLKNQARLEIISEAEGLVLDHLFELLQGSDFDCD